MLFFSERKSDHRDLPLRTHTFPTRRPSCLQCIDHSVEDGLRIDRQFRLVELEVNAVQHNRVANNTTGKIDALAGFRRLARRRSEEHTSELQSTMRNSYAVFC